MNTTLTFNTNHLILRWYHGHTDKVFPGGRIISLSPVARPRHQDSIVLHAPQTS